MTESAPTHPASPAPAPASVVWDDEIWVLATYEVPAGLGLTLQAREPEALGQLDDDHASQLGRITNRLVRIIEHQPGAGSVSVTRVPGPFVNLAFEVEGVPADRLHDVAVKLANWGGQARA